MLKLAIFAACLAATLAQFKEIPGVYLDSKSDFPEATNVPDDAACCTPDVWEGLEGIVGGYARFIRKGAVKGFAKVAYDSKKKMVASFSNITVNRRTSVVQVIEDYNKNKLYYINRGAEKCRVMKIKREFKRACIPKSAKNFGKFYYGAGSNKLNCQGYRVRIKKGRNDVEAHLAVIQSRKTCIPVGELLYGRVRGVSFLDSIGFVNLKTTVDPAIFSPPDYCDEKKNTDNFEVHEHMEYREYRVFGI